jgi:hypothetical protein
LTLLSPEREKQIGKQSLELPLRVLEQFSRPRPSQEVADWAEANVSFNEPKVKGRFSLHTREYLREPLNLWRLDHKNTCTDLINCMATRSGKTRIPMVGACYRIRFDTMRALWLKPMKKGAGSAQNDAKTKFIPMLKASTGTKDLLGLVGKYDITIGQQSINGTIIDWEGTGSPKQLAGNPDDVVIQDECDGYMVKGEVEAHPSVNADERTKDALRPFRYKCSTPTVEQGVIWSWLMKSDLRRRFVPCPRCNPNLDPARFFVMAWSEQFNVLPLRAFGKLIPIGYVHWDREAKAKDGDWDYQRVIKSAHVRCPFCEGKVTDADKAWMDKHGQWRATKVGMPGVVGFHLSSLYVSVPECSFGNLAKKFLGACSSGLSLKGFINSDLAEVDVAQEHGRGIITLADTNIAEPDWVALLTCDVQKLWPYLWFVIRKWSTFKVPISMSRDELEEFFKERPELKVICERLAGAPLPREGFTPIWFTIVEALRFCAGGFPVLDWLSAQKIHGDGLIRMFKDRCGNDTKTFGQHVYREMGKTMPRGGDSELVAVGHCDTDDWGELRDVVAQFDVGKGLAIPSSGVCIDAGYQETHNPEVLRKCFETGTEFVYYDPFGKTFSKHRSAQHCKPCPVDNWQPFKGYPMTRRWSVNGVKREWHHGVADPFSGSSAQDTCVVQVLESASDYFWLMMHDVRNSRGRNGYRWSIAKDVEFFPKIRQADGTPTKESRFGLQEYERHMDSRFLSECGTVENKGGKSAKNWPDHLNDMERNQFSVAASLGVFSFE